MPLCPRCNEQIEHLNAYWKVEEKHEVSLVNDSLRYEHQDTTPLYDQETDYECPVCFATLFYEEDDALNFLEQAPREDTPPTPQQIEGALDILKTKLVEVKP